MLSKKLKGLLLVLLTGSIGLPLSSCAYQDNIDSSSTSSESSDSMDDSSMEDTSSGEDTSSISSSDGIDYQALFPGSIQYATYDGVISYTNKTTYIQIDGYVASSTSSKAGIVDIPNTISNLPVTTIKDEAFKYATLDKTVIRTIIIPDSITTIGIKSFYGLYDVTTIQINPTSNLVSIGRGAFSFCLSLTDIYIPSGVKSIPDTCFYHCESLGETTKEYYYYDTTSSSVKHTTYTSGTDYTAGITYASTPTVCMFGMNSFGYCYGLTTFTCPSSLRIIKDRTFIACENLTTVVLNNGLVKIDREVFMYCSALESVNLNNESSEGAGDATIEIVGVDCFSTCNTTNEYGYTIYTPVLSLYKVTDGSLVDNTIDGSGTASDETTTPIFGYVDGWAVFCTNFAYNNTVKIFSFLDSTIGIASDVLQLVPNVTSSTTIADGTGPIYVSLPDTLMYMSNNFFRQSGDYGLDKNSNASTTFTHPISYNDSYLETNISFRKTSTGGTTIASTTGTSRFKVISVTDNEYYTNSNNGTATSQTGQMLIQMYNGYTFRECNGTEGDYYENQVKCIAVSKSLVWKYQSEFTAITFASGSPSSITKLTQLGGQCAYGGFYFFKQFGTSKYYTTVTLTYDLYNVSTNTVVRSVVASSAVLNNNNTTNLYNYTRTKSDGTNSTVSIGWRGIARFNDEIQAVFDRAFEGNSIMATGVARYTYIYPNNIQLIGADICAANILANGSGFYNFYHFVPVQTTGIKLCYDPLWAFITICNGYDSTMSNAYWYISPCIFYAVTFDFTTYAGTDDWVTK